MIIGNGLLAKAFSSIDNDDYIFFCSGVSDSTEVKDENFKREIDLLKEQDKEKKIIYFSSISVCDDKDLKIYTQHKRNVEIQIHGGRKLTAREKKNIKADIINDSEFRSLEEESDLD